MNAKEARGIVEKYKHLEKVICDPRLKTREDIVSDKFLKARSYLECLEGPEVLPMVSILERICSIGDGVPRVEECLKILDQYRKAVEQKT
jgi:hypothetical protein